MIRVTSKTIFVEVTGRVLPKKRRQMDKLMFETPEKQ